MPIIAAAAPWDGLGALAITLLVAAALCSGLAKGGFSGFGVLATVLIANVFPAKESTGILLPMLILADIVAVCIFRYHANFSIVWKILPPAVIGIVIGWLIMPRVNGVAFSHMLGWMIIGMLGIVCLRRAWPRFIESIAMHHGFSWSLGTLAGITTMISNAAGPVMGVYLLARRIAKMEIVGISAWFFFIVNILKVPFSVQLGLFTGQSLYLTLVLAPVLVGGVFLGRWCLRFISQNVFEWLLVAFSLIGALRLVLV